MDLAFISSMLDKGIVVGLFVITFIWGIYKGIPAAIRAFRETIDKINAEHSHQINTITKTFETTISTITDRFIGQIENYNSENKRYHDEHGKALEGIRMTLQSHEKSLKSRK